MQEQAAQQSRKRVVVVHRIHSQTLGEYEGRIKLVDPDNGEIIDKLSLHLFTKCHEIYASYKLLINSLRYIADQGYTDILLDTNIKRFADEVKRQDDTRPLQRQLLERCVIYGIKSIEVI